MTKTQKYLVYGGAIYLIGYLVWKKFYQKPSSVLVSGSSDDLPEDVNYVTAKELGADGTTYYNTLSGRLETMFKPMKKPIYISPKNSIPNVYDRGIGQDIDFLGFMNASGGDTIQNNCNKANLKGATSGAQLKMDMPKLPS
jgi:hypothetical protein